MKTLYKANNKKFRSIDEVLNYAMESNFDLIGMSRVSRGNVNIVCFNLKSLD